MKKIFYFFLLIFSLLTIRVGAYDTTYVWPVKGKEPGSNILYKPNDFLGDEQIYYDLIISTGLGDTIISPLDGIIDDFYFTYKKSLSSGIAYEPIHFFNKPTDSTFKNSEDQSILNSKYFTATISLINKDGKKIFLTGFIPTRWFKTGERLKKGDILGKASYAYHKILEQCLFINVSKNAIADDPMIPFGLKSSYLKTNKYNPKETISKVEMLEDLDVLKASLWEGHPGLFEYVSEHELQMAFNSLSGKLNTIKSKQEFEDQISLLLRLIRDSHLSVSNRTQSTQQFTNSWAAVSFGFLNDSLVITRTVAEYTDYLGRRISKVNGLNADTIKKAIARTIGDYDGYVESYPDFVLLTLTSIRFFHEFFPSQKTRDLKISFYNGETIEFKGNNFTNNSCPKYYPSWREYYNYPDKRFFTSMVSDKIAHIGLSTFDLNDLEMIEIQNFIQFLNSKNCNSLIIDLRNNSGGNSENLSSLFDLISKTSFRLSDQMYVNSNTTYSFFKYAGNYSINDTLFNNYFSKEGKKGFFHETKLIEKKFSADKTFKGDVFVLVNERSFSASAVFAGLVKKYNRGIIIGRETGSAYYQVNALSFVTLILPNSLINIRIPLIKIVLDSIIRPEIPWGRGVIPDFSINFSLDELGWKNDTILNTAIQHINLTNKLSENGKNEGTLLIHKQQTFSSNLSGNLKHLGIASLCIFILLVLHIKFFKKTK